MYRKGKKVDYYTELAKKQGYPARSVFKLKEIDEKYKIFKKGDKVLDLGSAPGSWIMYVSEKVGEQGFVLGVDTEDLKIPERKNIKFVKKSVFSAEGATPTGGQGPAFGWESKFDVVISDMAPNTTGVAFVDEGKSLELSEKAFELAKLFLKPGGNFVCKIFESPETADFFKKVKSSFDFAKRFKPKAVIKKSREFYIACKGFKTQT